MNPEDLTLIQFKTLKVIDKMIKIKGYSPSIAEIARRMKVYPNAIQGRVVRLIKLGYIFKEEGISRTIQLTDKGREAIQ